MARAPAEPDPPPEPDRVPGAPHPREAHAVIRQDEATRTFVDAARSGRLHHAWLLTGPRGTGKATFAWAAARWLLSGAASDDLTVPPDDATARRIRALSEPRLALVRRPWDEKASRLRAEITVEEIRKLLSFFHLSAAEGGRRVAIIDAADELNPSAANALLKMLEEPPKDATIFLVAHQPARLLPTIRSRCRVLRLAPLAPEAMAGVLADFGAEGDPARLAALSGGSVGEALRLTGQDGLAVYQQIVDLFATLPRMDRQAAARLAAAAGARPSAEGDPFDLTLTLLDRFLGRLARTGLLGAPFPEAAEAEAELLTRLAPDADASRAWATAQAETSARARAGRAVNLDPSALVMDMLLTLAQVPAAHGQKAPA
ncbi:DNA polymerase III subunit delta' [Paracoccus sp. S-4012]|uniref:DNA polymerase III subunit delta' n=1 Tax=Paracoccus sp. S-4012 TaxID=2665648 RepID=UPI0012B0BFD6|nr:DNA polymerase III subunit delta' [Paracoccus sp. S-4012]MRX50566.1 DNA polymerase III subunit delta' [Paracoccus sp. S-4012]